MAQPFSTTDSQPTFTYADGSPVTAASITVVVTFPDRSVSPTYSLANGDIQSLGSGKYKLTYQTRDSGISREVWTVTDTAGAVGQFQNDTEAKY